MSAVLQALLPIAVAIFNAVGPAIVDFVKSIAAHPGLDDNGKAAIAALGVTLADDEKAVDAVPPLDVPNPKPTVR